ncbi:MAG: hypothetical protein WB697_07150 [Stellaceae bacterium]
MKLNSHNEWDYLRAVIVGTVEGFAPGLEFSEPRPELIAEASEIARTAYPDWYLAEVAEDLEALCEIFRQAGVEVLRPRWQEASTGFATPNWAAVGFDIYNVRDLHTVIGDTLIVSAPSSRFRLFETYAFHDLFYRHFFDAGFRWISAPLPRLRGEYRHEVKRPPGPLQRTEDTKHQELSQGLGEIFHYLDEDEIIFDAANIIRVGRDILYLVSSTGNRRGAEWLQAALGNAYQVHATNAYRSSHLDSTILPLRPGLVLLNGVRVCEETYPPIFGDWDRLYFTDVAPLPPSEVQFHREVRLPIYRRLREMGVGSELNHISSPWAGLNVMSLSPDTVLVHDRQVELIRALEAKRLTVVPVGMRRCYTMLGGLHCTTLDVVRDSLP